MSPLYHFVIQGTERMSGVLSLTSFKFNDIPFDVIVANSDVENKSYFFGSRVATALGYKRPDDAVRRHCRNGVNLSKFGKAPVKRGGLEFQPYTVMIPESDVYRLIMRSKIQEADEFQNFICDTVLPSIRKHGQYPPPKHQQQHAIGYNIGFHRDRMKHFETLSDEQRKDMRKETLTETNSLKSERHVDIGSFGGKKTQSNIKTLQMDYEDLKEKYYRLQEDYDLLQEEFEFHTG